jgi:hypothetical protein
MPSPACIREPQHKNNAPKTDIYGTVHAIVEFSKEYFKGNSEKRMR